MKLAIHFRERLRKLSKPLIDEFEELHTTLATWGDAEHNDEGRHTTINPDVVSLKNGDDEAPALTFENAPGGSGWYLDMSDPTLPVMKLIWQGLDTISIDATNGLQFTGNVFTFASGSATFFSGITQFLSPFSLANPISPAELTSNQNDYSPTGHPNANWWRLTADAARDITGISATGVQDGQVLVVSNIDDTDTIRLMHDSGSSTAANRILGGNNTNISLQPRDSAILIYDGTSTRWRQLQF